MKTARNTITSFATLPVGTWLEILKVNEDPARDDFDKQAGTIALLNGLTERQVLALPVPEYRELARQAEFLGVIPERIPRAASSYKVDGYTLTTALDMRKITAAQYIDFQTFLPEGEKRLVELLSVALVPKGETYNDGSYDIAEVQRAIRNDLTVEQALSLIAFFMNRLAGLIRSTKTSLSRLTRKEKDKEKAAAMKARMDELQRTTENLLRIAGAGSPM
jgi:hypothetical protein